MLDQDRLRVSPEQAMLRTCVAGVRLFQYRNKTGSRKAVYETSRRLANIARDTNATFIVNDYTDIALAVEADGVHLGQDDLPIKQARALLGPTKLIGISTHSVGQAQEAENQGADYIGFGPIFPTTTKDAGEIQGVAGLANIRKSVTIPIVAIGGIKQENVADVIRVGADCVAIIGAILNAEDLADAASAMINLINDIELSGGTR
ncbi:MAG TPA: thiamine phosphate synthase [Nitrospirota bacterium]|nr:thiamine phosphate synthase [Nitrospirota bacterium]